jgi:hypothetical protein
MKLLFVLAVASGVFCTGCSTSPRALSQSAAYQKHQPTRPANARNCTSKPNYEGMLRTLCY